MPLVFVYGGPVVNTLILTSLYSNTPLPQLVMVGGVIAYDIRSSLILMHSTMTAQWYVHDILQPHVLPLMARLPGAIFQQNNTQPHTARIPHVYLRHITTLPWPSRFPDLSPIEYIWDHLGWQVGQPTSWVELEACLQQQDRAGLRTSYEASPNVYSLSRVTAAVAEWYRYRIVAGIITSSSPVPLKTRRVDAR
ncbi:transposable element Tcb2 transposase [Trichonephila clavipes]|nr:transposable element Tcb2 transposase [Trichonephila clavipes]